MSLVFLARVDANGGIVLTLRKKGNVSNTSKTSAIQFESYIIL